MSAKGQALAGHGAPQFVLWGAEAGTDFERLDVFEVEADAVAAARDVASQRRHVSLQITLRRRVVRRFPVGDQEAA
jgi:hypothetical protein